MRRVLIVAFYFAPENTSGTHRSLHFARKLVESGVDVTVLTRSLESIASHDPALEEVFPWPERVARVAARPTRPDRVLESVRRLRQGPGPSAVRAGVSSTGSSDRGRSGPEGGDVRRHPGRLRGFMDWAQKFPDVHKGWLEPAVQAGSSLAGNSGFDAVFASGPPWTCLRAGAAIASATGAELIVDFRDPWTRRSGRTWNVGGPVFDLVGARLESKILAAAAIVQTNSPGITDAILGAYPRLDPTRVLTILNGSDVPRREAAVPFPAERPLVARHFGSLYAGRRIGPVVQAAARRCASDETWTVEQIGPAPSAADLTSLSATEAAVLSVKPTVPFREAVERMQEPSLLVMIQPEILSRQVPTKLYDYLCTGNPVLVLAVESSASWDVARRFDRCYRADPSDIGAIEEFLSQLGARRASGELLQVATREDTKSLSKESIGDEFVRVLDRVCPSSRPGPSSRPT